jgi:hypothetical protein
LIAVFKGRPGWFPNPILPNLLAQLFFGSGLIDAIVPRPADVRAASHPPSLARDRFLLQVLRAGAITALAAGVQYRYLG